MNRFLFYEDKDICNYFHVVLLADGLFRVSAIELDLILSLTEIH